MVGFVNCKKNNILTQDFSITLTQDYVINNVNDTVFSGFQILDAAAQNSDLDKYKDHIQDLTLTKVTYSLVSFTGPADQVLLHGAIDIADTAGVNRTNLTSMSNVNLHGLLNNETELTLNQTSVTWLTNRIKNSPHAVKVFYSGNVNKKPLNFTIRLKLYVTMKAELL